MEINLIEYFERTVSLFPNKLAVSDDTSFLSFKELEQKAKFLANHISKSNLTLKQPIAIYLPKTCDAIVSFIASLYSGNCYAPLDIKNPTSRIHTILNNLKPICIITNNKYAKILSDINLDIYIINIDQLKFNNVDDYQLNYTKCIDIDPAYIIHTSGSTGIPKGVAISHKSIFNYINWAIRTFGISHNEIIGNQAPFIFDNSTLDIYLMVFTGASLLLIPEQHFMFPAKLLSYIEDNKINFVFWVPTVLINIANLDLLNSIKISTLKKILFAGEVMPTKYLNYWMNFLSKEVIYANLYGPTEITVDCTFFIVDREFKNSEVLPIGRPCRNSDVLILNRDNKICDHEEHGELCVRGTSLALGYWNNFEKTNNVFVQNPLNNSYPEKIYRTGDIVYVNANNEIIFVGRKDFQIKHLGYRIELGEIEHKVISVFESIKVCSIYDQKNKEIVLFYESDKKIPFNEFRLKLTKVLSKYMIPTKYLKIKKIPLTNSGKTDRSSLNKLIKKHTDKN